MRDARLYKRLPFDGEGTLHLSASRTEVTTINISKGGACLRVSAAVWSQIEEQETISGTLGIDGQDFQFKGRICWSSSAGELVHFGVEFLEHDRSLINQVLEQMSIQDADEGASFNI